MTPPLPFPFKRVLVLAGGWPEPGSSAAGVRSTFLLNCLLESGSEVHFASTGKPSPWRNRLEAQGIHTAVIEANHPSFDTWLAELRPEAVIFERFFIEEQFSWRVAKVLPEALRILDTHDLHFLRSARERSHGTKLKSGEQRLSPGLWKGLIPLELGGQLELEHPETLRELTSILRSHLTWVVSGFEFELLTQVFGLPTELISLSRWGSTAAVESTKGFTDRFGFCHIGNYRHAPNAESVQVLLEEVWPQIRRALPQAKLHLYGAYPSPSLTARIQSPRAKAQGIFFGGTPPDAKLALSQHRVSLAPLLTGAGIKGKIIDSWAAGTPVVTTPIGTEGLEGMSEAPLDLESFCKQACLLHESAEPWNHEQSRGFRALELGFNKSQQSTTLIESLTQAFYRQGERHPSRWLNKVLLQDTLRATEYFSRWITLKNEKQL
jgi:hypothetical protein